MGSRVRVYKISSINDPETGMPGKQIELVEVRQRSGQPYIGFGGENESRLIKGLLSQFQSLGLFPQMREMILPKITLFFTEDEYELLGIRFEVNDIYELDIKNGSITFKKPVEGV